MTSKIVITVSDTADTQPSLMTIPVTTYVRYLIVHTNTIILQKALVL